MAIDVVFGVPRLEWDARRISNCLPSSVESDTTVSNVLTAKRAMIIMIIIIMTIEIIIIIITKTIKAKSELIYASL